jgi:hypothetical protein
MAKMWRRTLRDDDDDDDDEDEAEEGRYRRPRIEARQYDPSIIENLAGYDDDDDDADPAAVDELLAKIRKGKYKPKRHDHWSLHVAYNLIQTRGR